MDKLEIISSLMVSKEKKLPENFTNSELDKSVVYHTDKPRYLLGETIF